MYDICVIGAGHAGIEAAAAAAREGMNTLLITENFSMAGSMPCNPSVGGPAKGIVVREIDALGGLMPKAADATALQFKMLNTTKGPGVWSLRVQSDKEEYKRYVQKALSEMEHLSILEAQAKELVIEDQKIRGIRFEDGSVIECRAVVLTAGTFMDACVLRGHTSTPSGPEGQEPVYGLSESLRKAGIRTFRLKTGTPPRVARETVDFSQADLQPGSEEFFSFSELTRKEDVLPYDQQWPCYLIHTTPKTHEIIRDHLHDSAMYSGLVKGKGPRYCPSIEDKLVRFADKERHQLFLEPESRDYDTIYIQGFSTSMPVDVQEEMVHSLPGMENAKILKYAYAIEYDAIDPLQMKPSLENKIVENLFTAGQVNGTSGYEEAAGQGLIAGANAALKLKGKEPIILRRDQAYIGVMIDDLTTKGTQEPYRLLTSRAEYRLLLRHDNASERLIEIGYRNGLVDQERYEAFVNREKRISDLIEQLKEAKIRPDEQINKILADAGQNPLGQSVSAADLIRRPHMDTGKTARLAGVDLSADEARTIEIRLRYEGYIEKARKDAERMNRMESRRIPADLDYSTLENLSLEAREKLGKVRPLTLGQASRISGVNPADIALLAMYINRKKTES